MQFGPEFVGTRLAVIFNLHVAPAERRARLTAVGNPVLHNHDGTGVYIVAVPDGQNYFWVCTYRSVAGVVSVEEIRPVAPAS